MKSVIVFSLAFACVFSAASGICGERPIVAVFDIEMRNVGPAKKKADDLTDYLCSLLAGKGFQIVPRAKLRESLQEKKKESYKHCYNQACQIEIGQELSAQKSLSAQVLKLGGKCKVTLTLYDLKRSTSEKGSAVSGGCEEAKIVDSLERAVEQLVRGSNAQPPALTSKSASPVEKAGLTWVRSEPAEIDFTKSEITVAQYRACVEAGKCTEPESKSYSEYCNWGHSGRDNHPINCVDWNQATAFCTWAGGRLPTEQEWEAEASNKGTRRYPWGDQDVTCDYAVMKKGVNGCGSNSTWPVCSKTPGNSVSGLCDMSGNLWEWTSSSEGNSRVVRGGSWGYDVHDCFRASGREWKGAAGRYYDYGFRCCR